MSGYALIHRTLLGHHAFRNDAEAMAFAWMVVRASWKESHVRYKDRRLTLQRGQLAVSVRDMAAALDRDKAWVERLWKRLKSETMIETVTEKGVTVVTISNYNTFQGKQDTPKTERETPDETGARQVQDTEQYREYIEEDKEDSPLPPKGDDRVGQAVAHWNMTASETGWPQIAKITDKRSAKLKARLIEHGLDGWRSAVDRARMAGMLTAPPPSWFTFDFLTVNETNICKVLEGNYDRKFSQPAHQERVAGVNEIAARRAAERLGIGNPQSGREAGSAQSGSGICGTLALPHFDGSEWDAGGRSGKLAGRGF